MFPVVAALAVALLVATNAGAGDREPRNDNDESFVKFQAKKDRELWEHRLGYFVMLKDKKWQERGRKNNGLFDFVETRRTPAFVELYDKSRGVTVQLKPKACFYKGKSDKTFSKLYDGKWQD